MSGSGRDRDELRDRLDIIDVCTRLHWYVDHKEWDQLALVLSEHVSFPTPAEQAAADFDPGDCVRSRADIQAAYPALLGGLLTQHLITGHQVELDGDHAVCRAHAINIHIPSDSPAGPVVTHGNEYRFDLERTGEGWRICGRQTWIRWRHGDEAIHDVDRKLEGWAQAVKRGQ